MEQLNISSLNEVFEMDASILKLNATSQNVNMIYALLIEAFETYRIKINEEYANFDAGEHKQELIGKKWTKTAALAHIDLAITNINLLFNDNQLKYDLPSECL